MHVGISFYFHLLLFDCVFRVYLSSFPIHLSDTVRYTYSTMSAHTDCVMPPSLDRWSQYCADEQSAVYGRQVLFRFILLCKGGLTSD